MAWIDYDTERFVKKSYPGRWLSSHLYRIWQPNRYIQIKTSIPDDTFHYEIINGRIELHMECDDYESKYGDLVEFLIESTDNVQEYQWGSWDNNGFRCSFIGETPDTEFENIVKEFIAKFDELINIYCSGSTATSRIFIGSGVVPTLPYGKVGLELLTLNDVLSLSLKIPDYQRAYCWDKSNVDCLLDDILEHFESGSTVPYRLGCIILHSHNEVFDIIDGQQRLVTLALLCDQLGVDCSLLDEKFKDEESLAYIAYNKSLIKTFSDKLKTNKASFARYILEKLEFSVLILQNSSLDLAYTFFSHQNSRGVSLTDYDLLKAHHLRYIPGVFEKQAYRAAESWNRMIEKGHLKDSDASQNVEKPDHEIVLDTYLYNLRKWMRHLPGGDDGSSHRIKVEYEAAPIIDEIPPFGEKFYYNEPIQGGVHFFEWVRRHVSEYDEFSDMDLIKNLRRNLSYGSDNHYRNALEALLFGYYLKFGTNYLAEAFVSFLRIVTDHRYKNKRASISSVLEYVSRLNLIQMIDQATSPTFVLAECRNMARNMTYPKRKDMRPIQKSMRTKAERLSRDAYPLLIVESFKMLNS